MKKDHENRRGAFRSGLRPHYKSILEKLNDQASYRQISEWLKTEHNVSRSPATIWTFVQRRINGSKPPSYPTLTIEKVQITQQTKTESKGEDVYAKARERVIASRQSKAAQLAENISPDDVYSPLK